MPDLNSYATMQILQTAEAAIRDGGGEYVGVQPGVRHTRMPDLVLFNDPLTGTTLALAVNETSITAQKVRTKITLSRQAFRAMQKTVDSRRNLGQEAQSEGMRSKRSQDRCASCVSKKDRDLGEGRRPGSQPS